jgi:hypothetical protein
MKLEKRVEDRPELRLIWCCGMIIWHDSALLVCGMGWSKIQIARTTRPVFFTLSGK